MTLIARIQQEMNVDLQLKDLFQAPTIESLAQAAAKSEKNLPFILKRRRTGKRTPFRRRKTAVRSSAD